MSLGRTCQPCLLFIVLLWDCWPAVQCSYYPVQDDRARVSFSALSGSRFPPNEHIVESAYQYFLSEPTFNVVDGKVICGAADKLYILNVGNLSEVTSLSWEPETTKKTMCLSQVSDPDYNCHNHIRVHQLIPGVTTGDPALMVCGTQATKTPQCRVVTVGGGGSSLAGFTTVDASEGIISYFPDFSQFGEFRNDSTTDDTFFTAGFFSGDSGLGRHFSISFQSISVSDTPTPNSLTTTERFRTINANNNWLRFPVTFVDYFKLDYAPPATGGNEYDYQFYFGFIRENSAASSSDGVIQSRVVRICRNDAGFVPADPDLPYFTTYMKARIFCERQLEDGDEFEAGLEFLYNELRSVAFTEGGRYRGDGSYGKKLYGAFTGPIVGPHGTAICVYNAENTEEMGGNGRSQSMFDIFREDLQTPMGGRAENSYIECDPDGRSSDVAQNILVNEEKFVSQLENDPLFVMDGLFVNQMVLDEQCVVTVDDPNSCRNQDILFLGTDSGKVLKVVFARDGPTAIFPVVAEEISLDDDNNIEKMVIHDDGDGGRNLFVNTNSKIYKLPLAECSRHQTCLECVGVRDPYCVWDVDTNTCVSNPFSISGDGTVTVDPTRYKQNIHTGSADTNECIALPHCDVNASAIDYQTMQVEASCTNANQITVGVVPSNGLVIADDEITLSSEGTGSTTISGTQGLQSYTIQVTATQTGANPVTIATIVTTPPGPPVTVETDEILIDSITSSSVRVSVNIDKFTDYFSQYSFKLQGGLTSDSQMFTDGTSHTLTQLTPATDYTFIVEITNSITMVTSPQLTFRTLDAVPSQVQNLVTSDGMRNVELDWDTPSITNGDIIGYSVKVGEVEVRGCGGWGDAMATSYDVTGLTPYTGYTFTVAACTTAGEGPVASISRTTQCSNPEQVVELQLTPASATTLNYSWSEPDVVNGPTDTVQYEVVTTCYLESGVNTNPLTTEETSSSISSLLPLTLCCVRVTPVNTCQGQATLRGPPTEICNSTSDITPGLVTSLMATPVSREAILITWAPPTNYQRSGIDYVISVSAPNFEATVTDVTDVNHYYMGGLEPAKEYTISVCAGSGGGMGDVAVVRETTLPNSPSPPDNLIFNVADSNTLVLSWGAVEGVSQYVVVFRCNKEESQTEMVTAPATSVNLNVANPTPNFAWCTAQVQSENSVGRGEFSDLVSVAIPASAPATPRCYLLDDQGSSVSFSFDVTHPFSLDSLSLRYKLIPDFEDENSVNEEAEMFTGNNVVAVAVSRNTMYSFRLRLCNSHGCSDYCTELSNFTTSSTAPRPPTVIKVSDLTHNSVVLSWDIPNLEDASTIGYLLDVTSSGSGGGQIFAIAGIVTDHMLSGLDAETLYSVAIQVRVTETGIIGVFGPAESFTTIPGVPSRPTALDANWVPSRQELSVSWGVPSFTNGTIRNYQLIYSGGATRDCSVLENSRDGITVTFDAKNKSFVTMETSAILETKSFIVCVRGYTDQPGEWATFLELEVSIEAITGTNEDSKGSCNGLIAVAVVAGVAVVSTVISAVVLFLVVRHHNNQVSDRHRSGDGGSSSSSSDQMGGEGGTITTRYDRSSPSRGSNDTGFDEQQHQQTRPPLQSQDSLASTNTLKPLLPNGRS